MSKEPSGAASEGESVSPQSPSWFGRLRAQPGFRTAAVAFVLTVVLGIGGSAAYALWSLKAEANLSVATALPDSPEVSVPTCNDDLFKFTRVGWTAPVGMRDDAVYIVRISTSKGSVDYAFPRGSTEFRPADLRVKDGEALHSWMGIGTGTVTVSTGFLAAGVGAPGVVDLKTQVLKPSKPSPGTALRSNSSIFAWFTC